MEPFEYDDDEEECRVCRGPAEEGRPLRKPCRCSGSIGLIHQECLQSWLNQRGTNTCELCKVPFRFSARYADETPERLSPPAVILGISRRFVKAWLPFSIRVLFAALLWLVITPMATTCLYHCWVSRPDAIFSRLSQWKLVWIDLVTGDVLVACTIVSFLSLMSFADFLRAEWQRPRQRPNNNVPPNPPPPAAAAVDNTVWDYAQQQILRREEMEHRSTTSDDGEMSWNTVDEVDSESSSFGADDDSLEDDGLPDDNDEEEEHNAPINQNILFPDPAEPDPAPDQVDLEFNIAIDEVLGFRGPVLVIIRNLCWLLAFNAVYLGIFVFIPRTVGSTLASLVFWNANATNTTTQDASPSYSSLSQVLAAIEEESIRHNTAFRLRDLATVVVGYFTLALAIVLVHFLWFVSQRVGLFQSIQRLGHNRNENNEVLAGQRAQPQQPQAQREQQEFDPNDDENLAEVVPPDVAIGVALKATTAIVKVGILLFVKMFILPVVLGIALDCSTMSLTGVSLGDQVAFAGRDIFSSILLHWVAGITFMLLVTVSVLQLREVAHPDLLAQMIRPQEPQPDLLGNLMTESVATHGKRMVLSLLIYAFLLAVQVYVPIRVLMGFLVPKGAADFFRTRFAFVMTPQLQAPLELLVFHLSMLALLEYYKNGLGGLQHSWLKFISHCLGLSDRIIPHTVAQFGKIGKYPVFSDDGVDNFWYTLALAPDPVNELEKNVHLFRSEATNAFRYFSIGDTKPDGERILRSSRDYIRLPQPLPGTARRNRSVLLPTRIGKYRLKQSSHGSQFNIHLWEEVPGVALPRPPEGWDDLAPVGGADQGRWAWGAENKSVVERGVATRTPFFGNSQTRAESLVVGSKVLLLVFLSWCFTTGVLFLAAGTPLAIGRLFFFLLRFPDNWIHDPFAFFVGFIVLAPYVRKISWLISQSNVAWLLRVRNWMLGFTCPPPRKCFVLAKTMLSWCVIAPFVLGVLYELAIVTSADWFKEPDVTHLCKPRLMIWSTGSALLYIWSGLTGRGVLTREFRLYLLDRQDPAAPNPVNWNQWQGQNGRVSRFFAHLGQVLLEWNWELVDDDVFFNEFSGLVVLGLLKMAAFASSTVLVSSWWLPLTVTGQMKLLLFRCSLTAYCLVAMSRLWHDRLMSWFEKAHQAARDDRYLIGEILLNYNE